MSYILIIGVIIILIFFLDYRLKLDSRFLNTERKKTIKKIMKNGMVIDLDVDMCEIFKNDTYIKHDNYEAESVYSINYIKRSKYNVKDKTEVKSILICKYVDSLEEERTFIKHINMDSTLLKIKINMQKKIKIYLNDLDDDDFYIDLNFLYN